MTSSERLELSRELESVFGEAIRAYSNDRHHGLAIACSDCDSVTKKNVLFTLRSRLYNIYIFIHQIYDGTT